jgi:oligo-1,6-glucosidase
MTVAEGAGNSFEDAHNLVDENRKELNMAYAFDAVDLPKRKTGYSVLKLKEIFTRFDSAFSEEVWLSIFLANHDQARLVSRFGNDAPQYRELSSKMLNTFLLTMRGTPYCYYGDELGMTNAGFTSIGQYRDKQTMNEYKYMMSTGADKNEFLKDLAFGNRDNGRTPLQWDTTKNAGFTTGAPWISINKNYVSINVAAQEKDANSCLNYFKKAVQLRKKNPAMVYGKYELLDKENPQVYAYTREWEGSKFLVLLNFSSRDAKANIGMDISGAALQLHNYPVAPKLSKGNGPVSLRPYEALVFKL